MRDTHPGDVEREVGAFPVGRAPFERGVLQAESVVAELIRGTAVEYDDVVLQDAPLAGKGPLARRLVEEGARVRAPLGQFGR